MKNFLKTELNEFINLDNVNSFRVSDRYVKFPNEKLIEGFGKVCSGSPVKAFACEAVMTSKHWEGNRMKSDIIQITEVYQNKEEAENKLQELVLNASVSGYEKAKSICVESDMRYPMQTIF